MDYIEKSQAVKNEILSVPSLLTATSDAFEDRIEPFNGGGTAKLYHVGRLPSGLYVALRNFRTDVREGQN